MQRPLMLQELQLACHTQQHAESPQPFAESPVGTAAVWKKRPDREAKQPAQGHSGRVSEGGRESSSDAGRLGGREAGTESSPGGWAG